MRVLTTLAALCLCAALIGCESSQSTTAPSSPGAVGECPAGCSKACCASAKNVSPGALDTPPCCASKSASTASCPGSK